MNPQGTPMAIQGILTWFSQPKQLWHVFGRNVLILFWYLCSLGWGLGGDSDSCEMSGNEWVLTSKIDLCQGPLCYLGEGIHTDRCIIILSHHLNEGIHTDRSIITLSHHLSEGIHTDRCIIILSHHLGEGIHTDRCIITLSHLKLSFWSYMLCPYHQWLLRQVISDYWGQRHSYPG